MSLRAAATQFGYLVGAGLGGLALAAGGYSLLGGVLAILFVLAVVPHLASIAAVRRPRGADSSGSPRAALLFRLQSTAD